MPRRYTGSKHHFSSPPLGYHIITLMFWPSRMNSSRTSPKIITYPSLYMSFVVRSRMLWKLVVKRSGVRATVVASS